MFAFKAEKMYLVSDLLLWKYHTTKENVLLWVFELFDLNIGTYV